MPSRRTVIIGLASVAAGGFVLGKNDGDVEATKESLNDSWTRFRDTLDSIDIEQNQTANSTESDSTRDRSSQETSLNIALLEQKIHDNVNTEREHERLSNLAFDDELRTIAQSHSQDMAINQYFSHTSPRGETVSDRYEKFRYECRVPVGDDRYTTGGENLFRTRYTGRSFSEQEVANQVVDGWMDSPSHRENILRPYWDNEGIGVFAYDDSESTNVYATQNFC